ncbi:hypothetical protein WJX77_004880 [Trebouxia sp. C0004]
MLILTKAILELQQQRWAALDLPRLRDISSAQQQKACTLQEHAPSNAHRGTAADVSALQHITAAKSDQCSQILLHTSFAVTPLLGPAKITTSSPWSSPPRQQDIITPSATAIDQDHTAQEHPLCGAISQLTVSMQVEVSVRRLPGPNQQLLQHLLSQQYATSMMITVAWHEHVKMLIGTAEEPATLTEQLRQPRDHSGIGRPAVHRMLGTSLLLQLQKGAARLCFKRRLI